jgi:hypothetical protein
LRAKLAKWRKGGIEIFERGPTHFLIRATVNGTPQPSETLEELSPESCDVATLDVAAIDDGLNVGGILAAYRRGLLVEHHPDRSGWVRARRSARSSLHTSSGSALHSGVFCAKESSASASMKISLPYSPRVMQARLLTPVSPPRLWRAFAALHQEGHAHSVEVLAADGGLVGGLYGVAIGKIFLAEAKFEHVKRASTVALAVLHHHFNHWGFALRSAR